MCITGESESGHGGRFEPCAEWRRLKAENAALRQERDQLAGIVHECMATLGMTQTAWERTDIPRGENDLPRWVRDVSQASYEKGKALEKADALADHMLRECECCETPCESYALTRYYQEARHG